MRSIGHWIAVAERVPDDDREVLATDRGDAFFACYAPWDGGTNGVKKGNWYRNDEGGYFRIVVTHWMDIPELPA